MFREIQSINVSLKFPYKEKIRRLVNDVEDFFSNLYHKPTVLPVPDEIEPMIPRITLNSKNGHSTINIYQIGLDFVVNFDDQYRYDYNKCEKYIRERMILIHSFLKEVKIDTIYYMGLITQIRYLNKSSEDEIRFLKETYLKDFEIDNLYDYNQKITLLEKNEYYHNITIGNYRDYTGEIINGHIPAIVSFEKAKINQKGLFVVLDINNRYKYTNNGKSTSTESLDKVFEDIYSYNRDWIDSKIYKYIPINNKGGK